MGHHAADLSPIATCRHQAFRLGARHGLIQAGWTDTMAGFAARDLPRNDAGGPAPLIGAFPFVSSRPGVLYGINSCAEGAAPAVTPGRHGGSGAPARGLSLTRLPSPGAYGQAVAGAITELSDPDTALRKVVLARALEYRTDHPVDPIAVAHRLGRDPHVVSYALPLPRPDAPPQWLVGATPELLLRKQGAAVCSHPLAGSARRSDDSAEDQRIGARLLHSSKDLAEHRYVVDYIHDVLAPHCATLAVPEGPALQRTASMWHLGTEIHGTLRDPDMPCLALLNLLHPTPAVAGTPLSRALEVIAGAEPEDRGFYAGTLGWLEGRNDGTWYVTLRCALIDGERARLHAGAGIVAESTPEAEIAETRAKFIAMRDALGIDTTF